MLVEQLAAHLNPYKGFSRPRVVVFITTGNLSVPEVIMNAGNLHEYSRFLINEDFNLIVIINK